MGGRGRVATRPYMRYGKGMPSSIPTASAELVAMPIFQGLGVDALEEIRSAAQPAQATPGEAYVLQGEPATRFYLLRSGRVRLSQVTPEGQQVIMRFIAPGEEFGIVAVLGRLPYPVTAEAVEASVALAWTGAVFQDLILRHPQIGLNGMAMLAERVKEFQDRLREAGTQRVERRVANALLRLARQAGRAVEGTVLIDLPLSRQDLAEMTGTTLFSVSRVLAAWEERGLVGSARKRISLLKPHALVSIAEDLPEG